ncbi:hypothetical protein LINGRAHAP2_LOCUS10217 [Linum grandiflorum]
MFRHGIFGSKFSVFLSMAALGSLMWLHRNKPKTLMPLIYACAFILATMPSITSYLRRRLDWVRACIVSGNAIYQLATILRMSETFILGNISLDPK